MRVFEVRIGKNRSTLGECGFAWPSWWGEVYQDVDVVAYQDDGLDEEGAVCICQDEIWELIAAKEDPLITELTKAKANAKGRAWRPQVMRITNQEKVLLITAKVALGKAITAKGKKALDPEDSTPGVNKSPLFDVAQIAAGKGGTLSDA